MHLTEFQFTDETIEVDGFARDASILIGLLEEVDGFSQVRFTQPVRRDERAERDAFRLALTLGENEGGQP